MFHILIILNTVIKKLREKIINKFFTYDLVAKIKDIFENLKLDHTIIIVTHKKDIMSIADKIIVLNNGKIVGIGTHDELLKDNEYYIDLQTNNYSSSHKKSENIIILDEDVLEQQ